MCQYTHRPKQSDFKLCMVNVNVVEICFIEQRDKERNREGEGEELRRGKDNTLKGSSNLEKAGASPRSPASLTISKLGISAPILEPSPLQIL